MTQALEAVPITSAADIVAVRQKVRELSIQLKFSLVDQTKMVTAASELARNALEHGKGGTCQMEIIKNGVRQGLRLVFQDQGPGIADVELAMRDGYTTGNGLGLGSERKQAAGQRFRDSFFARPGNHRHHNPMEIS